MRPRRRTARRVMEDTGPKAERRSTWKGRGWILRPRAPTSFPRCSGGPEPTWLLEVKGAGIGRASEGDRRASKRNCRAIPGVAKVEDSRTLAVPSNAVRAGRSPSGPRRPHRGRRGRRGASWPCTARAPTAFREEGKEIPVRVRLREPRTAGTPRRLGRIVVPSPLERARPPTLWKSTGG
jgi:hypothetical protein